jgi:hypothetical protein
MVTSGIVAEVQDARRAYVTAGMVLAAALYGLVAPHRPGFVNVTALIILYFLPTIVAGLRRSTMTVWVVLINLLAGWTVLGWLVALVMAIASSRRQPTVGGNVQPPAPPSSESSAPGRYSH